MRCLFIDPSEVFRERITITDPEDLHHLSRVLRSSPGDRLNISDGHQTVYRVRIVSIAPAEIETLIESRAPIRHESPPIILAQALIKSHRWEMLVEKVTELGVSRIIPVITERSRRLRHNKRERWEKIVKEAAKQCGRPTLVQLDHPVRLEKLASVVPGDSKKIILREPEYRTDPVKLEELKNDAKRAVVLLIGPEGGWSESEMNLADETGFEPVVINPYTLRSETAAIAAVGIMAFSKCHESRLS